MIVMEEERGTDKRLDDPEGEMSENLDWVSQRFDRVDAEMKAGFDRVNAEMKAGFDRVDAEMEAGFNRVDAEMKAGFDRVDAEMKAGFDRVDERFERVDAEMKLRFKEVDHRFDRVESDIKELRGGIETLHADNKEMLRVMSQGFTMGYAITIGGLATIVAALVGLTAF